MVSFFKSFSQILKDRELPALLSLATYNFSCRREKFKFLNLYGPLTLKFELRIEKIFLSFLRHIKINFWMSQET